MNNRLNIKKISIYLFIYIKMDKIITNIEKYQAFPLILNKFSNFKEIYIFMLFSQFMYKKTNVIMQNIK